MNIKNKEEREKKIAETMRKWRDEVLEALPEHRAYPRKQYLRLIRKYRSVAAREGFTEKLVQ
jgi:hypothetical protein